MRCHASSWSHLNCWHKTSALSLDRLDLHHNSHQNMFRCRNWVSQLWRWIGLKKRVACAVLRPVMVKSPIGSKAQTDTEVYRYLLRETGQLAMTGKIHAARFYCGRGGSCRWREKFPAAWFHCGRGSSCQWREKSFCCIIPLREGEQFPMTGKNSCCLIALRERELLPMTGKKFLLHHSIAGEGTLADDGKKSPLSGSTAGEGSFRDSLSWTGVAVSEDDVPFTTPESTLTVLFMGDVLSC